MYYNDRCSWDLPDYEDIEMKYDYDFKSCKEKIKTAKIHYFRQIEETGRADFEGWEKFILTLIKQGVKMTTREKYPYYKKSLVDKDSIHSCVIIRDGIFKIGQLYNIVDAWLCKIEKYAVRYDRKIDIPFWMYKEDMIY